MTSTQPPLKFASDTDYTPVANVVTTVTLVLSTIVLAARVYARYLAKVEYSWDDYIAPLGYLGLVANAVANYIMAETNTFSTTPPTPQQMIQSRNALTSVGITYPLAIIGGKLSLLFLLRRLFGMRTRWFRISWWTIFLILFPCWITAALTFAGLSLAGKISLETTFNYAVPTVSFINTITDLAMCLLPIKMIVDLQITWRQRLQVVSVLALGSAGTVISLVRSIRSIQSARELWDPRYHVFSEASMGIAEAGIVNICACLPVTHVLFVRFGRRIHSTLSGSAGRTRATAVSLKSSDDDGIQLSSKVIHRTVDYRVDSESIEDAARHSKNQPDNRYTFERSYNTQKRQSQYDIS